MLQLYSTKKDGVWLQSGSEDVKKLVQGEKTAAIDDENRRKHWCAFNLIPDKNKRVKTNDELSLSDDESGTSYKPWSKVKRVFRFERYTAKHQPIPDREFKFLVKYLKYVEKATKGSYFGSTNSDFIAPVLVMICNLFDDAKLEVDETVTGHNVHADGHFEYVLARGKTKICIVEAKDSDFVRGKAQVLVGCEAVAEREGLHVVYGIVTGFLEWDLYRCGDNSIFTDVGLLKVSRKLDIESLRCVCEMIYGVLSDQEEERKEEKA